MPRMLTISLKTGNRTYFFDMCAKIGNSNSSRLFPFTFHGRHMKARTHARTHTHTHTHTYTHTYTYTHTHSHTHTNTHKHIHAHTAWSHITGQLRGKRYKNSSDTITHAWTKIFSLMIWSPKTCLTTVICDFRLAYFYLNLVYSECQGLSHAILFWEYDVDGERYMFEHLQSNGTINTCVAERYSSTLVASSWKSVIVRVSVLSRVAVCSSTAL